MSMRRVRVGYRLKVQWFLVRHRVPELDVRGRQRFGLELFVLVELVIMMNRRSKVQSTRPSSSEWAAMERCDSSASKNGAAASSATPSSPEGGWPSRSHRGSTENHEH